MKAPYIYQPDELIDLGLAGFHPITVTAWISVEYVGTVQRHSVNITRAVVEIIYGEQRQELDVTSRLLKSHYTIEQWEDDVWKDYLAKQSKEFNEGVGA